MGLSHQSFMISQCPSFLCVYRFPIQTTMFHPYSPSTPLRSFPPLPPLYHLSNPFLPPFHLLSTPFHRSTPLPYFPPLPPLPHFSNPFPPPCHLLSTSFPPLPTPFPPDLRPPAPLWWFAAKIDESVSFSDPTAWGLGARVRACSVCV